VHSIKKAAFIFKPGMPTTGLRVPGFLKLFYEKCVYVCTRMIRNKNFKQGIGIAEKSLETRRDRWGW